MLHSVTKFSNVPKHSPTQCYLGDSVKQNPGNVILFMKTNDTAYPQFRLGISQKQYH